MATSWDEYARTWDGEEAVRAYARAAYGCVERLEGAGLLAIDGARILDFGCGTGLLTEQLATRATRVVAIDASAAMIEVLVAKVARLGLTNVDAVVGGVESAQRARAGEAGAPFDLLVCSSVCAFLDDYPGAVSTLVGLLRPGGWFIQWDWELAPDDPEPFGLTRDQTTSTLLAAGLDQVVVETAFEIEVGGHVMRPIMGRGRRV